MSNTINPPLPSSKTLDDLNPDLAFSYELAQKFVGRSVSLSLEERQLEYQEIQIGYTKRPAWFPYVSIHTGDTDFRVKILGQGADLRARAMTSDFAVLVRDESSDEQLGRARLSDLKYDVARVLGSMAAGGQTFRSLAIETIELVGITPEEHEEDLPWGHSGQVLAIGKVSFT